MECFLGLDLMEHFLDRLDEGFLRARLNRGFPRAKIDGWFPRLGLWRVS